MPSGADPLGIYEVAETLRECATEALSDTSEGLPNRAAVITGAITWDECECGELIVALTDVFPSDEFPTPSSQTGASQSRCGGRLLVAQLTVSMLRCSPTTDGVHAPPVAELQRAAQVSVEDAFAVRNGITCCLIEMTKTRDTLGRMIVSEFAIQTQRFVGPQGMCQGSELDLAFGLVNACPCEGS